MSFLTNISSSFPSARRWGELVGLQAEEKVKEVEEKKETSSYLKDLRLVCLVITSLGVIVKTIVTLASKVMLLLQGMLWLGASLCLISLAINAALILASSEERDKLKEKVQETAGIVRSYISEQLFSSH